MANPVKNFVGIIFSLLLIVNNKCNLMLKLKQSENSHGVAIN